MCRGECIVGACADVLRASYKLLYNESLLSLRLERVRGTGIVTFRVRCSVCKFVDGVLLCGLRDKASAISWSLPACQVSEKL